MAVRSRSDLLSVRECLGYSYEPDREFVDGRLEERVVGEFDHARVPGLIFAWFRRHEHVWVVNPAGREGLVCSRAGWNRPEDGRFVVLGTEIYLMIAEIFTNFPRG